MKIVESILEKMVIKIITDMEKLTEKQLDVFNHLIEKERMYRDFMALILGIFYTLVVISISEVVTGTNILVNPIMIVFAIMLILIFGTKFGNYKKKVEAFIWTCDNE